MTSAAPPDPVIAAGPNHLVLVVNHTIEIYNKSGTKLQTNTLTNWFSDTQPPPPGDDPFDPKVVYDHYSGRWIVLALAKDDEALSSYLISVSQTSDPTGAWYKYNLDATLNGSQSTNYWADFPGLGYDSQAIYLTSDQLTFHTDLLAYYSCSHALHGNTFIIEAIASNNSPI